MIDNPDTAKKDDCAKSQDGTITAAEIAAVAVVIGLGLELCRYLLGLNAITISQKLSTLTPKEFIEYTSLEIVLFGMIFAFGITFFINDRYKFIDKLRTKLKDPMDKAGRIRRCAILALILIPLVLLIYYNKMGYVFPIGLLMLSILYIISVKLNALAMFCVLYFSIISCHLSVILILGLRRLC